MQKAVGLIKATNATLTVGLGFIPEVLRIVNLTDRTAHEYSDRYFALANDRYGIQIAAAGTRAVAATAAAGVSPYAGGDLMSAASTQYLVFNDADQKAVDVAAGTEVTTFTLDTAANYTGHFNCDVTGATIGPGSRLMLGNDPKIYKIVALTAGQGIAADEVGLDASPGSGAKVVSKIWSKFDYTGAPQGVIIPKGFNIGASANVNDTDGDILYFEAMTLSA